MLAWVEHEGTAANLDPHGASQFCSLSPCLVSLTPRLCLACPCINFQASAGAQGREGQERIKTTALRDHVAFTWMCEPERDEAMGPRFGRKEISTVSWQGRVSMEHRMKPYEQMQEWVRATHGSKVPSQLPRAEIRESFVTGLWWGKELPITQCI